MKNSKNKLLFTHLPFNKDSKIESLTEDQVQQRLGFGLISSKKMRILPKEFLNYNKLEVLSAQVEDQLVVCEISEGIGCGVFSSIKIPANTIVAEYVGEVVEIAKNEKDLYLFKAPAKKMSYTEINEEMCKELNHTDKVTTEMLMQMKLDGIKNIQRHKQLFDKVQARLESKSNLGISAKKSGNIARFFNHFPSDIDSDLSQIIQTANLKVIPCGDSLFLYTTRDIEQYEQLGYDYGEEYWKALEVDFKLFEKQTNKAISEQDAYNKAGVENFTKGIDKKRYLEKGNIEIEYFRKAILLFNKSLELGKNSSVLYNLGRAYEELQDYDNAIKAFQDTSKLNPDHVLSKKIHERLVSCSNALGHINSAKLYQEELDQLSNSMSKASINK